MPKESKDDEGIERTPEQIKEDITKKIIKEQGTMIEKTNKAAERLENANKRLEENIAKHESLAVERELAGKADAGEGNKKESNKDYAEKVMANDIESKDT